MTMNEITTVLGHAAVLFVGSIIASIGWQMGIRLTAYWSGPPKEKP